MLKTGQGGDDRHRPAGIFITGTDTGIGKTVLTAALLMELRARGLDAVPMKPVQTGAEPGPGGGLRAPDLEFALRAAGMDPDADTRARMAPQLFREPCSPHLAAELEGRTVDPEQILTAWNQLGAAHEFVLAEGAGGVLVPVDRERTMLDLMRAMGCPVLVAARPSLGTLNHSLLTLHELARAGLRVAGLVLIESTPERAPCVEEDNRRTLERLGGVPVYGPLPYCEGLGGSDDPGALLRERCGGTAAEIADAALLMTGG
ncbi:dethiobiotin synthase [Kiritimatiella glycovorans]|uniref:dethiobiotin synthase n=1 Tax=Kiritimatiella glycovorans TaxID=1307763 RepID=UPI00069B413F|nr:dethiobiotin synthase [Kiritimatiella glycovorans]